MPRSTRPSSHIRRQSPAARGARGASRAPCSIPNRTTSEADLDSGLLDDEPALIAGVIPVPPSISTAMQTVLERAMLARFDQVTELHEWMNASHPSLHGAAPFERLLDGNAMAVLRALIKEPLIIDLMADTSDAEGNERARLDLVG